MIDLQARFREINARRRQDDGPTKDTPCVGCGKPLAMGGATQRSDGSKWWCRACTKAAKREGAE